MKNPFTPTFGMVPPTMAGRDLVGTGDGEVFHPLCRCVWNEKFKLALGRSISRP